MKLWGCSSSGKSALLAPREAFMFVMETVGGAFLVVNVVKMGKRAGLGFVRVEGRLALVVVTLAGRGAVECERWYMNGEWEGRDELRPALLAVRERICLDGRGIIYGARG